MPKLWESEADNLPSIHQTHDVTHRRSEYSPMMNKCYYRIMEMFEARWLAMKEKCAEKGGFPDTKNKGNLALLTEYTITNEELGIDAEHAWTAKAALVKIQSTPILVSGEVKGNDDLETISPISHYKYSKKNQTHEITLTTDLCKYYLECKIYDKISPLIARTFNGQYTPRFYEWACQWRAKQGWFVVTVEQMREEFLLYEHKVGKKTQKAKYKENKDLKRWVFDPSIEEIKKAFDEGWCDFWLKVEEPVRVNTGKRGRPTSPTKWRLWIMTTIEAVESKDEDGQQLFIDSAIVEQNIERVKTILQQYWTKAQASDVKTWPAWIAKQLRIRATNTVNPEPNLPWAVLTKLNYIYKKSLNTTRDWSDVAKIIRKVLWEEFHLGAPKNAFLDLK